MEDVRLASINERRFIISEALGHSHCGILIASYTGTPSAKSQLGTSISNALKQCIDEHPALSTIVKDADTEHPRLVQVDSIDLTHHIEYVKIPNTKQNEQQYITRLLDHIYSRPLPPAGGLPQWRVYVSEAPATDAVCFYLAFVFSHVLIDGVSSLVFHNTFLRAINGGETPLALERWSRRPEKVLSPPVETAGNLRISWLYLLSILIQEFLPIWLALLLGIQVEDSKAIWTGSKIRTPPKLGAGPPPTAFEVTLIENSTLKRALQACRKHNTRLTSLLNYLIARALRRSLSARGQTYHKFKVGTAIDLRRAFGKGQGAMANWVSTLIETIAVPEHGDGIADEAWEAMKQSTLRLVEASSTLSNQPIGLIKYIPDLKSWMQSRASQPATVSFGMSNIGVIDGAASGESHSCWQTETAVLCQTASASGAPFDLTIASTKDGGMTVVIMWWPGMLGVSDEKAFIRELLDEMKEGLESIE